MTMDDSKRAALSGLKSHPGWEVLMELMEDECELLHCDFVDVKPEDHGKIIAAHNTERAARQYQTTVINRVDAAIRELSPKPTPPTADEAELQSILTPYPVGLPDEGDKWQPKQ